MTNAGINSGKKLQVAKCGETNQYIHNKQQQCL